MTTKLIRRVTTEVFEEEVPSKKGSKDEDFADLDGADDEDALDDDADDEAESEDDEDTEPAPKPTRTARKKQRR